MEQNVAYWMMNELNGLSQLYESTISDCFHSVCHKYNVPEEKQLAIKEQCIERVTKALNDLR